jgi:hypothetical protein
MLLFMRPANKWRVSYALTDDHQELVREIQGPPPFTDIKPLLTGN